ncbi:uncharacterized membrane protein YGR149W [Selaginella moellendorffii]|uniref:uncharacterized membrane protein YGR149W n=1 Tax=Selaginella moellendorffii TaxID=88036 RepID=UPI000D1D05C3|nr:uncharacterized membrane protein YGR149W [Selaginella moellendorffii]|eukprot:XP_024515484.1 uncharacterized membrane protein YGR149W [Selaginella moellendorffii]
MAPDDDAGSPKLAAARRSEVAARFLSERASIISRRADEHEQLLNKVTYCIGVFCFGTVCYVMGSRPHEIPYLYCLFFLGIAPLRWIYYRTRKWHYYLLDFCYYANVIFMAMLLVFPNNEKLFMVCFSFSEGPLAWALIVWRCSLVFSSIDKIISVLIHLLPGTVFFIIRWWDPITYPHHSLDATGPWPAWPLVHDNRALWTWLFFVPLIAYSVWQALYLLIVNVLRKQRLLRDPEVMTSFRELSRKAARANNIWWWLSGLLGERNRVVMYAAIQAAFTVATMALTVPMFKSYRLHVLFELFKAAVAVWNGGKWLFDVMPRQMEKKKTGKVYSKAKTESSPENPSKNVISIQEESSGGTAPRGLLSTNCNGSVSSVSSEEKKAICSLCQQLSSRKFELQKAVEEATSSVRDLGLEPALFSRIKPTDAISCAS